MDIQASTYNYISRILWGSVGFFSIRWNWSSFVFFTSPGAYRPLSVTYGDDEFSANYSTISNVAWRNALVVKPDFGAFVSLQLALNHKDLVAII